MVSLALDTAPEALDERAPQAPAPLAQEEPAPSRPDGVPADGRYEDVDVAIVMESTYPYLKGGVSAVVHDIITGNPDKTFGIIHIAWDSEAPHTDLYGMPSNVAWVRVLYLSMAEHRDDFLAARPRDLRMSRAQRRALSRRLLGALIELATTGDGEEVWRLIDEGMSPATRRYPLWALLGTQEFMEAFREMMPDLGMPLSELFWCLRDFFSLAHAVLADPVPRAAVYHAHTTGYASLLAAAAARQHGASFLLTEHNLYVRDTVNTLLERRMDLPVRLSDYRDFDVTARERMWMAWWIEMGRLCYPRADLMTYLYPRAIEEAKDLGGIPDKSVVLPNGLDVEEFDALWSARREAIERIHAEGDRHLWRLVYIARVVPIKGLLDLIEAVEIMRERGMGIHLDVCGPTEHVPEYYERCTARIVELGLQDVITIRGTVRVRELLDEFDLFVLPSYNEGLPVVSLETMGAGIPTVSSDVGALRSVVEDPIEADDGGFIGPCGLMLTPGDPALLAERIHQVISNPGLYEDMCRAARRRVETAFNLGLVNATYNRIYNDLASRLPTAPARAAGAAGLLEGGA